MIEERLKCQPIYDRLSLSWPNGSRVPAWIVFNVEHYEFLPNKDQPSDTWHRKPHSDGLGCGLWDNGNRVGLWRLPELIDALNFQVTLCLDLGTWLHYPQIFQAAYQVIACDGAKTVRVLLVRTHAWLFGMPRRIQYFDEMIEYLLKQKTAWHAPVGVLADWCQLKTPLIETEYRYGRF